MEIDKDKIDDAILALLYLTLDGDGRAWKGFDWSAMNRLHEKGFHRRSGQQSEIRLAYGQGDRQIGTAFP